MTLSDSIARALRSQAPNLSPDEIAELTKQIAQRIAERADLANLSDALLIEKLQPTLQIMLARDHSSIANAAQYAIQVLVTQVIEDPGATIPDPFRTEQHCPYPGLPAFSEAEADLFYGREDDIQAFLQYAERPVTAITGPSGVGKSSLVLAGIVPRLKARYGESAAYLTFRISTSIDFFNDLARFLAEQIGDSSDTILGSLHKNDGALLETLQRLCGDQTKRIFLVLDQFEELFVGDDPIRKQERRRLLDNLLYVDSHEQQFLSVIIATRENYFEHSDYTERPRLVEIVQRENIPLDALTDQQLRDAIERPLEIFNRKHAQDLEFQTGLVDLIVQGFRRPAVSLPLVQYLLRLLWTEKHHLTHFAYNSLGGLERVLDRHAQAIYNSFSKEDQSLVKAVLIALVRPGLGSEYTRKRVRRASLFTLRNDPRQQHLQIILQRLSDSRSRIVSEEQIGDDVYLELTHEILLRQWTFLQELVEARKERIEERERLLPTAELWEQSRRSRGPKGDPSYLYRGDSLRRARHYVEDMHFKDDVDSNIMVCYTASRQHQRRMRTTTVIVMISGVALVALAFNWFTADTRRQLGEAQQQANERATAEAQARQQANEQATAGAQARQLANERATAEAQARQLANERATAEAQARQRAEEEQRLKTSERLASEAQRRLNTAPDTALLLAYEAVSLDHNTSAVQALRDAIGHIPFAPITPPAQDLYLPHFSPDDRYMLVSRNDASELRDLSGQVLSTFPDNAFFSPDGARILTSVDGRAKLWDLSGKEIASLEGAIDSYNSELFSTDGLRFLTRSDGKVWAWDRDGHRVATFEGESPALAPNGQYVFTSMDNQAWLWDFAGNKVSLGEGRKGYFSPDAKYILTSKGVDTSVTHVWDMAGQNIADIEGSVDQIVNPSSSDGPFSPDGRFVFVISAGDTAHLWSLEENKLVATFDGPIETALGSSVQFSPDGDYILTSNGAGASTASPRLWDRQGHLLHTFSGKVASLSPNGQYILTYERRGTTWLWNLSGQQLAKFDNDFGEFSTGGKYVLILSEYNVLQELLDINIIPPTMFNLGQRTASRVMFSRDGQRMLIGSDEGVDVFDAVGRLIVSFAYDGLLSPDGKTVLTRTDVGSVLWDLSGKQLVRFDGVPAGFSPDGQSVLTTIDKHSVLWNLNGEQLATFDGIPAGFNIDGQIDIFGSDPAGFTPDSRSILTYVSPKDGKNGSITLWDLNGTQLATFQGVQVKASKDGQYFLSTTANGYSQPELQGIDVWLSDRSGKVITGFKPYDSLVDDVKIALSPDGKYLLTVGRAYTLVGPRPDAAILWNNTGNRIAILDLAYDAVFSPDGQLIATISADDTGSVRLWNLNGQPVGSINDIQASNISFSPDGKRLLVSSGSGVVRQYFIDVNDLLAVAACRAERGLIQSEIDIFQVPMPLHFDYSKRQCPPRLSWVRPEDANNPATPPIVVQPTATVSTVQPTQVPATSPLPATPLPSVASQATSVPVQPSSQSVGMFRGDPQHTGFLPTTGRNQFSTVRWKYETNGEVESSPVIADGVAYVGSDDGRVYALNIKTGELQWSFTTNGKVFSSPAVAQKLIFFGSRDGFIYALDRKSGQPRWTFQTGDAVTSSPVIIDGHVYIGSLDGNLYTFNAETGQKVWQFNAGSPIGSSPAVADRKIFFGCSDGRLLAVDIQTGQQVWAFQTSGSITSSPAVASGIVYLGSKDSYVYAIDAQSGQELWRFKTAGPVVSSPAIAKGRVFVGSGDNNLYAVDGQTGQAVWKFATGGRVDASPVIVEGVIYIGSIDTSFYAVDIQTGQQLWEFSTASWIASSATADDGMILFGSADHFIYAIE